MPKWKVYHVLARNIGLEIEERTMKEIDDLIDDPNIKWKSMSSLRKKFAEMYCPKVPGLSIFPEKCNFQKKGRSEVTAFKMQLKLIAEYYNIGWNNCEKSEKCRALIKYYLLHNLTSYIFDEVIPENKPLWSKKSFVNKINEKFLEGNKATWNSLKKDPEFKWIFPIYSEILDFIFTKIKLKDTLPLFCEKDKITLEPLSTDYAPVRFCPICGNMYIQKRGE